MTEYPTGENCSSGCVTRDHVNLVPCRSCGLKLPDCKWYFSRKTGTRLYPCRSCSIDKRVAWSKANPERHAAKQRAQRAKDPRRARDIQLRSLYMVDIDYYDAVVQRQQEKCAICGQSSGVLVIDHDHACCPKGHSSCGCCLRGLLCNTCNLGVGMLADDPERMREAARYVERFR